MLDFGWSTLMSWLSGLGNLIFCAIVRWVCWFLDYFFKLMWTIVQAVFPTIPDSASAAIQWGYTYYAAVDSFVPVSDGLTIVVPLWVTVNISLIIVRVVRRMLPF